MQSIVYQTPSWHALFKEFPPEALVFKPSQDMTTRRLVTNDDDHNHPPQREFELLECIANAQIIEVMQSSEYPIIPALFSDKPSQLERVDVFLHGLFPKSKDDT